MNFRFRSTGLSALPLAVVLGCAGAALPSEELARAKAAVEQAEGAGATEHAALEMKNAREQLANAERLAQRDEVAARRAAEQAEVNALLAVAKARRAKALASVAEVEETIGAMQEEMIHDAP